MSIKMKVIEFTELPGHYVAGFDETGSMIQMTKDKAQAKKFSSEGHAAAYICMYGDSGVGLSKNHCAIIDA